MKNLASLYTILLLSCIGYAQPAEFAATDAPRLSDSRMFDAVADLVNRTGKKNIPPKDIKGTYYFEPQFFPAQVSYFGEILKGDVLLRYNAYNDELEIGKTKDQKETDQILLKSAKVEATFNDERYRLVEYRPKEDAFPQSGYLVVLSDGTNYKLYLQRKKVFMDAVEARTGLERSFPPRFVDSETYFYQIGDQTPLPLKASKSGLKKVFKGQEAELSKLLKAKKLKTNNTEGLKTVFDHFNFTAE